MNRALLAPCLLFVACGQDLPAAPPQARPPPPVTQVQAVSAEPALSPEETERLRAALNGPPPGEAEPTPPPPAKLRPVRRHVVEEQAQEEELQPPAAPSLSDDEFAATVSAWKGMRRCLDTDVSRVDTRAGAMRVSLTIRGDGSVREVKVLTASEGAAQTISACVEKGTRRLRFPAFASAELEVTKEAKFVF